MYSTESNQNFPPSQRLLLQHDFCFGHTRRASIRRLLLVSIFEGKKYASTSNCQQFNVKFENKLRYIELPLREICNIQRTNPETGESFINNYVCLRSVVPCDSLESRLKGWTCTFFCKTTLEQYVCGHIVVDVIFQSPSKTY